MERCVKNNAYSGKYFAADRTSGRHIYENLSAECASGEHAVPQRHL